MYFNDQKIPVKTFDDYVDLYLGPKGEGAPRVSQKINDRWEVCVSTSDGQFQQVIYQTQQKNFETAQLNGRESGFKWHVRQESMIKPDDSPLHSFFVFPYLFPFTCFQ